MKGSAGRVLMFLENAYPQDTRVRNEAELLTGLGYHVSVVCLRRSDQVTREVVHGVQVYRIPTFEVFQKTPHTDSRVLHRIWVRLKSLVGYVGEYVYFTTACLAMSVYVAARRGFDVIHAHNPPDTLWLVALPWKAFGKKFVFDHHDLCPELYRSRYGAKYDALAKLLRLVEYGNLKLADITIATNESYKEIALARGSRKPNTVFVVRNGPNVDRMRIPVPSVRLQNLGKKILVYVGSLNPQDGVDYLLRSLKYLRYELNRGDFHCVIIGAGDSLHDLRSLAESLGLNGEVEFTGFISDEELQESLAAADICMDPDPASPLNNISTWIKVMEYMAYGKPIVSFDLKETRYSAQDAAIYVAPNDEVAFARATARLMDDRDLRERMGQFGRARVERELQWSVVGQNLGLAYAALKLAH